MLRSMSDRLLDSRGVGAPFSPVAMISYENGALLASSLTGRATKEVAPVLRGGRGLKHHARRLISSATTDQGSYPIHSVAWLVEKGSGGMLYSPTV